jgi:hypothetical protein
VLPFQLCRTEAEAATPQQPKGLFSNHTKTAPTHLEHCLGTRGNDNVASLVHFIHPSTHLAWAFLLWFYNTLLLLFQCSTIIKKLVF